MLVEQARERKDVFVRIVVNERVIERLTGEHIRARELEAAAPEHDDLRRLRHQRDSFATQRAIVQVRLIDRVIFS
jgi:hypothetical protein